jgi:putative transposase
MRAAFICPGKRKLSIRRQCGLLKVSRSSLYYRRVEEKLENLKMMALMDKHLMNHPTEGVRSIVFFLHYLGYHVNHKRVRRLFRLMGRETIYRRKNLTKAGLREFIKPYLLRDLKIDRPNQVWCTDITYIPMAKGFMYLTAVIDVYSRKILSWGISNSLEATWCKQVLKEAVDRYGKPDIINSDQDCQYTSALWTGYVQSLDHTRISMDGKGRATDNIWIERFWKTIKYGYVFLNPCDDGTELLKGIDHYIRYYNSKTHHTFRQSPNNRYCMKTTQLAA